MSPPLLQRLVLVTTAVLCVASASLFNSPARGDDGAKSAHEAAVLDRIFAGNVGNLVAHLLKGERLSRDELDELHRLIDQHRKS